MKAIDLCAGAGGMSLGLHRAGFEVLGVEWNADAVETHRRNVGPCDLADIREWSPPGPVELVAGGVPCQSFSYAGARGGLDDPERGQLYRELLRVAVEAQARVVLFENVAGLYSWKHERTKVTALQYILDAFVEHGFLPSWQVINCASYGVAQRRERTIIVGVTRGRFRWPEPSHGPAGARPYVTVREALKLGDGKYARVRRLARASTEAGGKERGWWQGGRFIDVDQPGYTVGTRNNADFIAPADGRPMWRLRLHELAALQGFPPGFTFHGLGEAQHEQVGNAVPPPVAEAFGRAVLAHLRESGAVVLESA